jgi:hypothetical protein
MLQRPTAVGLFVCEQLIVEEGTHNLTVVNAFTSRVAASFPTDPIPFLVFALLTDGLGDVQMEVTINRLDNLEEIYRRSRSHRFLSPLGLYRFEARVRSCRFPVPGWYEVTLYAQREAIGQRRLLIVPRENVS